MGPMTTSPVPENRITVTHEDTGDVYVESSTRRRLGAVAVDFLVVIALTVAITLVSAGFLEDNGVLVALLIAKVCGIATIGGLSGVGASPGQLIAQVATRDRRTGRHIGWWRGTWRYIFYPFLAVFSIASVFDAGMGETVETNGLVTRRAPIATRPGWVAYDQRPWPPQV